jgi:heme exporter protein C
LLGFVAACVAIWRAGLAEHLVVGWALVIVTLTLIWRLVPIEEEVLGASYLIFYFHFPSAISCLTLFVLAGVIGLVCLLHDSERADQLSASAIETGVLACAVTLATGMIWAKAAWGQYWVWRDKRLLTVAIMFLTYLGYLSFRAAVDNPAKRARFCSALAVLFSINVPLVWFAIRWFGKENHPMSLKMEGTGGEAMTFVRWFGAGAFFVLYLGLWRLRAGTLAARERLDLLEDRLASLRI